MDFRNKRRVTDRTYKLRGLWLDLTVPGLNFLENFVQSVDTAPLMFILKCARRGLKPCGAWLGRLVLVGDGR
jgi:hypothetical protein